MKIKDRKTRNPLSTNEVIDGHLFEGDNISGELGMHLFDTKLLQLIPCAPPTLAWFLVETPRFQLSDDDGVFMIL
jgi:hypothetical protein